MSDSEMIFDDSCWDSSTSSLCDLLYFDSTESVDSISSPSQEFAQKKKRRKRYVVNLFPRVVKSDIRRFYPRMFANVANSTDPILLRSFMETYCSPQFHSVDILPSEIANRSGGGSSYFAIDNLGLAVLLYIFQFELFPDSSLLLTGSSIKQFRDDPERSELTISLKFFGTKAYDFVSNNEVGANQSAYRLAEEYDDFANAFRLVPTSVEAVPPGEGDHNNCVSSNSFPLACLRPSTRPFTISTELHCRIVLDSNNRFCSMESIYTQ